MEWFFIWFLIFIPQLLAVVLFAAYASAQNPYEYVDDDLIQRVGQIIFEYDQKVAASRGGNTNYQRGSSDYGNQNSYRPPQNQYQYQKEQVRVPEYSSNNYNRAYTPQVNRQQRQYTFSQPEPVRTAQPVPYKYQEPVQVNPQPQQQQTRNVFTGYSLSRPVPLERVAEFHFSENRQQSENGPDPVRQQGNGGAVGVYSVRQQQSGAGAYPVRSTYNNNKNVENKFEMV